MTEERRGGAAPAAEGRSSEGEKGDSGGAREREVGVGGREVESERQVVAG
jgi:hypothetical protein